MERDQPQQPDNKERLKEVHQQDLTESRVHEEFVDWLRSSGVSWLLFVLIALCAYFGIIRWREYKQDYRTEAWQEFSTALLPTGLEDIAREYADVDGLPILARIQAARQLLTAVQTNQAVGSTPDEPNELTDKDREEYLRRADRLYQEILERDDGSLSTTLTAVTAITGRAVIAESRGEIEQAKDLYEQAAARAEDHYSALAIQARQRAEGVGEYSALVSLPSRVDIPSITSTPSLDPATLEPGMQDLLMPPDPGDS